MNCERISSSQQNLINTFANNLASRNVNISAIKNVLKEHETKFSEDSTVCKVLGNFLDVYSVDYSTYDINEATLVRDTIDIFLRVHFPSSPLAKSIGADAMIPDSSKRFTRLDPPLKNHGKRADFSVISTKTGYHILSLEAKSNHTKHVDETVKLCKELKDLIKAMNSSGHFGVIVTGILMRGNHCFMNSMH